MAPTCGQKRFGDRRFDLRADESSFVAHCELANGQDPMDYGLLYEDRTPLKSGDHYYVRVEQPDTNKAWSSPVWVN